MIAVIDLKLGNVKSVGNALSYLKIEHVVTSEQAQIQEAAKLIFPGVGSFNEAANRLQSTGMRECIRNAVLVQNKPILGICLGMQLLATTGEEGGTSQGLGLIDAHVSRLRSDPQKYRLPHIGWNDVTRDEMQLFDGIGSETCFYFVHSYEMVLNETCEVAFSNYGVDFVAAVQKGHICGTQFHPEKSREMGLRLLTNFAKSVSKC
jgi:imidazole glycerol-phosphate synthase subunit HisH